MKQEFREYHTQSGFTLPIPASWEASEEVDDCALVAMPPTGDPQAFRPNVVVTVEELVGGAEAWVQLARHALSDQLMQLRILDTEEITIGWQRAWRTLSNYMHPRGSVNLEQWAMVHRGWGYVVSCSMSALDYDDLADTMAYIAEGLHINETAA